MNNAFKILLAFTSITCLSMTAITPTNAAEASHRRYAPTTNVSTVYRDGTTVRQVRNVTRYRDIERPKTVIHTKRIVNVTRIQPVTRINTVTRVHNRTAVLKENRYSSKTNWLPTEHLRSGKTVISRVDVRPSSSTVYRYKTIRQVNNVTRYRNVNKTRYVRHVNNIVTVRNIQPIVRTNVVTRVYERPRFVTRNQYVNKVEYLPTHTVRTAKTVQVRNNSYYSTGHARYWKHNRTSNY
ncbi:hypothetical protein WKW50_24995 [Ochrobactrum sp. GPK 3]|uniref:hypothetical protein n=1 Tax=Brucella sp. 22210 TaxID=3453892 RepID=UPI0031385966